MDHETKITELEQKCSELADRLDRTDNLLADITIALVAARSAFSQVPIVHSSIEEAGITRKTWVSTP